MQINLEELEYAEPDAFFTECSVVMAEGRFNEDANLFVVKSLMHPPLHANKEMKFNLNEQDYFGSYTKLTENLMVQSKFTTSDPSQVAKAPEAPV